MQDLLEGLQFPMVEDLEAEYPIKDPITGELVRAKVPDHVAWYAKYFSAVTGRQSKPEDIIASTSRGIYVQSLSGGSVNPVTGVFNFTCREAYLIENGKKTTPVKGATLIGNCMDVISNIDAVGNDLAFGPGICGKGQMAEVSAGQPTVRIRSINVGGSKAR